MPGNEQAGAGPVVTQRTHSSVQIAQPGSREGGSGTGVGVTIATATASAVTRSAAATPVPTARPSPDTAQPKTRMPASPADPTRMRHQANSEKPCRDT